jgi:hypothetical protein
MRMTLSAVAVMATLVPSDASAQGLNLSGRWQCVALCLGPPGSIAFITQYGWELNVVNDAGESSRAWVDYPGRRSQVGKIRQLLNTTTRCTGCDGFEAFRRA